MRVEGNALNNGTAVDKGVLCEVYIKILDRSQIAIKPTEGDYK